ncbi:competence protein ComEA [Oceanospirillum multiglobuliferum]|uniref:Helix-hairpin-helix DNA-binding motif class 1 domain-containing protein n=1 Tax=Oceanospirillum multiglobuliferum TaxID=64969 RepID=A0A1T4KN02_9GAMM|nr:ComEA family DNA-binding protein [Oceanospirillum multiglobuliferum]OPX56079.1 hypothetical protein BTE48_05900 [Oceanospirillum multiglobuliferum]SJZ43780.1 competence protein ComEA [Oceanospirillum multiglobuliferum]
MKKLVIALLSLALSFALPPISFAETSTDTTNNATVSENSTQININQADINTLQQLKGIGKKKAQLIVDYRTQNGAFKSIEELTQIKGISLKTLEMNKGRLSI